jgi:D-threo-aldose 1-dehydrogenase
VFNSGVLSTWPQPTPTYAYRPADGAIVERTARIAAICARHGVPLAAAALQFVLANAAISTVLLGPRTVGELDANLAGARCVIPRELWFELAEAGVVAADHASMAAAVKVQ